MRTADSNSFWGSFLIESLLLFAYWKNFIISEIDYFTDFIRDEYNSYERKVSMQILHIKNFFKAIYFQQFEHESL